MTYPQAVKAWRTALRHVDWCERKAARGSRVCTAALPRAYEDERSARLRMLELKSAAHKSA